MNVKGQPSHRSNFLSEDYEGGDFDEDFKQHPSGVSNPSSVFFTGNSRAEETIRNELYRKGKRRAIQMGFNKSLSLEITHSFHATR